MNVEDKVIIITGGAGGLGTSISKVLSENKAVIYILDLPETEETANKVILEITGNGGRAYFKAIDLTKEEEWEKAVKAIVSDEGRIDVLINNAGINIRKSVEEMSISEWMKMMEVNTGSVFLGCKYVIPFMKNNGGGAIINTSSQCGLVGHMFTTEAYTASKGAVTLLTKSIAARYGKYNIRCNEICPSTVDTPMVRERLKDPEFKKERLGEVPLGRLCSVWDVAYAVLYLASKEAAYINGAAFPIDGGATCD